MIVRIDINNNTTTTTKAGHDIKSLTLNLATTILFLLPFALYLYPEYAKEEIGIMLGGFVLAFLAPPVGVLRPHVFSDIPSNTPFLLRKKK